MFGLFLIFLLKIYKEKGIDKELLTHPISIIILLQLVWFVVTTFTSSMFLVSFKSTLARFTFIGVFYFLLISIFSNLKNIKKFMWLYMIPLTVVIFYTISTHAAAGFTKQAAHVAMTPFYNDHTAYAAAICFYIPILFAFIFEKDTTKKQKFYSTIFLIIFLVATVLSYTRAAWVGLIAAFACYFIYLFRIKTILVYLAFITFVSALYFYQDDIIMKLDRNDEVSSTDYASHVQSIGNVSSDDSNVERLNRWACAMRMYNDRPYFGFGPGTFMFQYGSYQKYSERSGISTNFGTGGSSHSEYLGPLSEQGLTGMILTLVMIIVILHTSSNFIKRTKNKSHSALMKGLILGLVVYWIHGIMNYFLDTEKASVIYWGFIAAVVALDLYSKKEEKLIEQSTSK
jgi:O-antigen ligase